MTDITPSRKLCIRPKSLSYDAIQNLVFRLYGLNVTWYTEFDSFADRNYHVIVGGDRGDERNHESYVLKILNSAESKQIHYPEGTNALMCHLSNHGITCSRPIPNKMGELYSQEKFVGGNLDIETETYACRLLTYIPGRLLDDEVQDEGLMFRVGRHVGHIDAVMQTFRHALYDTHSSQWSLDNVPRLVDYLHIIKDGRRRKLCADVIDAFTTQVVPVYDQLRKGVIHGDTSGRNIIVAEVNGQCDVTGVIDLSDASWSCLVFELSILIMNEMLANSLVNVWEVGGHVLAGYLAEMPLTAVEYDVIKICVESRIVQTLILGEQTLAVDPDNDYVRRGLGEEKWACLERLQTIQKDQLYKTWGDILATYSIQVPYI